MNEQVEFCSKNSNQIGLKMALNFMCDVRKEVQLICTKAADVFGVMCLKAYATCKYWSDILLT